MCFWLVAAGLPDVQFRTTLTICIVLQLLRVITLLLYKNMAESQSHRIISLRLCWCLCYIILGKPQSLQAFIRIMIVYTSVNLWHLLIEEDGVDAWHRPVHGIPGAYRVLSQGYMDKWQEKPETQPPLPPEVQMMCMIRYHSSFSAALMTEKWWRVLESRGKKTA